MEWISRRGSDERRTDRAGRGGVCVGGFVPRPRREGLTSGRGRMRGRLGVALRVFPDVPPRDARHSRGMRTAVFAALVAALCLVPLPKAEATAAASADLSLPAPTGAAAVGRTTLALTDRDRPDPWVPEAGPRRLMVTLFYPAV